MIDLQKTRFSVAVVWIATLASVSSTEILAQSKGAQGATVKLVSQNAIDDSGEETIADRARGYTASVTLDDRKIDSLIAKGSLAISVPQQLVDSIESVFIKRPTYFKDQQAAEFAIASLEQRKLIVDVDEEILKRIDYQPVDLKVYESGYDWIVLRYVGTAKERPNVEDVGNPKADSSAVFVKLKTGKGLRGRLEGMRSVKLNSSLGRIEIETAETRSIKIGKDKHLTFLMANGDRISGVVEFETVKVLTLWEDESIDLADVDSLEFAGDGN